MAEVSGLWDLLRQTADGSAVAALEKEVQSAPDRELNRINPLAFAARHGLREEDTISALVHASRLGLFDMTWAMLCPSCGGVLETAAALKTLNRSQYYCSFCELDSEPTLDHLVEVTFTVNPRARRIAAHDPQSLPNTEYLRQIFWSSGSKIPEDLETSLGKVLLNSVELQPGEKASMSLALAKGTVLAFDPVTHATLSINISGAETTERRTLSVVLADANAHLGSMTLEPGPVRISFDNKSGQRTLPALWVYGPDMDELLGPRRPFLTATQLLSNQTFRDLYRTATLDAGQRFKITNLTVLFTDLRGSTALYDRVGDLAAFDLVGSHFGELLSVVAKEGGAVVKTIGDAVMATFPTPDRAIRAAMAMREAMRKINEKRGSEDLALNIGLHSGPCLAVTLDDRQDYFGLSVNVASRVQSLAEPDAILVTKAVVDSPEVSKLLKADGYRTASKLTALRGVSEEFEIFEIRERDQAAQAA